MSDMALLREHCDQTGEKDEAEGDVPYARQFSPAVLLKSWR